MDVAAGAAVSVPAARLSPDSAETVPACHCATSVPVVVIGPPDSPAPVSTFVTVPVPATTVDTSVPPAADNPVPIALTAGPFHATVSVPLVVIGPPLMPAPDVAMDETEPPAAPLLAAVRRPVASTVMLAAV